MTGKERTVEVFHYEPEKKNKKELTGKKRVAAYCRVSTLNEEQDMSFETQCEYYEKLIENSADKELVGIYGDHGISGLLLKERTEFMRMMDDCRAGKIDEVITKSVSRFSRNMSNTVAAINELKSLGITVIFEREKINSSDPNSELFLNLLASIAQEESNSISQAIRWSKAKRAEAGKPSRGACYGYRCVPIEGTKDREWVIYEPEARKIRLLFDMASRGCTYEEMLPEVKKLEREDGGDENIWTWSRIYNLMRNEAYKGDILTNKHVTLDYLTKKVIKNRGEREQFYIEEHHEPIVKPEVFDKVQRMVKARVFKSNRSDGTMARLRDEFGIEVER